MRVGTKNGTNIATSSPGVGMVGAAGLTVSFLGLQALPGIFYAPMVARFAAGNKYEWWAGLENNGLATVSFANTAGSGIGSVTASAVGNLARRLVRITFTVAGTASGSAIALYVDGVLAGLSALTGTLTMQPTEAMTIGRRTDNVSTDLEGSVGDVQVWNRVLTADEVARYHRDGITGSEPGLVAWYPLVADLLDYVARTPTSVSDRFPDADGTNLNGKAAAAGRSWLMLAGTGIVQGGRARLTAGGVNVAVVDTDAADVLVSNVTRGATSHVEFRATDVNNRFYLDRTGGVTNIYRVAAGVSTQILFDGTAFADGDLMAVRAVGPLLEVYKNGLFVKSVVDTFNQQATLHGIGAVGVADVDDFAVTVLGPAVVRWLTPTGTPRGQLALQR